MSRRDTHIPGEFHPPYAAVKAAMKATDADGLPLAVAVVGCESGVFLVLSRSPLVPKDLHVVAGFRGLTFLPHPEPQSALPDAIRVWCRHHGDHEISLPRLQAELDKRTRGVLRIGLDAVRVSFAQE